MTSEKKNFLNKLAYVILGGLITSICFSGLSAKTESNNNQIQSNVVISENNKNSEQYYRTKTGKCYHRAECSCLRKSKILVTDEQIEQFGLKACSKC